MLRRTPILLAVLVLLGGFIVGLGELFRLRLEVGDVYPAYSSLRADPLGTKALYESLEGLPQLRVERNYREQGPVDGGRGCALVLAGLSPWQMEHVPVKDFQDLEQLALDGARLIFTFEPTGRNPLDSFWNRRTNAPSRISKPEEPTEEEDSAKGDNAPTTEPERPKSRRPRSEPSEEKMFPQLKRISIRERWGVRLDYQDLERGKDRVYEPVTANRMADLALPGSLPWHTAMWFGGLSNHWQVIYSREKHPVLIERRFGRGSVVLCSDSYLLTNEGLSEEPNPGLLAWLVGGASRVVFDETHLGVQESPGIMNLVRNYRLQGVFIGLLILAGLYVWKNASRFVTPYPATRREEQADFIVGRESAAGFDNLLRRNLPTSQLLRLCFQQWKDACARGRGDLAAKAARMETLVQDEEARAPRDRNPVAAYQELCRILAQRN